MRRFTRKPWAWLAVLTLVLATMLASAAPASAATNTTAAALTPRMCPMIYPMPEWCMKPLDQYRTAGPTYIGWTYLNLNYCPPGIYCVYRGSTPAWRWTGTAWQKASLPYGWVYVYPYTGQWRWAWTQQTGWLAISNGRFEIR